MIKRVSLVRKRPDITREEFVAHWLGPHAEIVRLHLPGLLGYVVNVCDDPDAAGWDGFAEVWFPTRADADAAFASEPFLGLVAVDRPKFVAEQVVFFVDEHAVVAPPAPDG